MLRPRLLAPLVALSFALPTFATDKIAAPISEAAKRLEVAFERMDSGRGDASSLERGNPTKEQLLAAAAAVLAIAQEIDGSAIDDAAATAQHLRAMNTNLKLDAVSRYARAGDKEQVLQILDALFDDILIAGVGEMLKSPMFAAMQDDPRFQMLIKRAQFPATMGKKSVIGTAFHATLTDAEKVAGLSLFWGEARRSFAHFGHVPNLDWDKAYLDFLPQVLATKDVSSYYKVMTQFAPLLQDGHTNIYAPKELYKEFYGRPAMRTALIGDSVLVTRVRNKALAQRVRVGDEVVAVDGVPVREYARTRVAPLVSSSTPQDKEMRTYDYQLLLGDTGKRLELTLRDASGVERKETVARGEPVDVPHQAFSMKTLPNSVVYLALDHFESDEAINAFEAALPAILSAKGLVLDLRDNGGGSGDIGLQILSYLIKGPIAVSKSTERRETNNERTHSDFLRLEPLPMREEPYVRERKQHYDGKVAVLIGPRSFSAAEDFLVSFDSMRRGVIVGSPSGGSTGNSIRLALPGGGSARICVKNDTYPDGRKFVGKGIMPQIAVAPTAADFRAGRDVVLEAALESLRK